MPVKYLMEDTHEIKGIFAFLVEIIRPYESLTFGRGGSVSGSSPSLDVGVGFAPIVGGNASLRGGASSNFCLDIRILVGGTSSVVHETSKRAKLEAFDVAGSNLGKSSQRHQTGE